MGRDGGGGTAAAWVIKISDADVKEEPLGRVTLSCPGGASHQQCRALAGLARSQGAKSLL